MPTEADPLLGVRSTPLTPAPPPTVFETWGSASFFNKALMVIGVGGAVTAGWAMAYTFELYGRALDMMARGTLVGADDLVYAYIRLLAIDLGGKWLQFLAFSWVASSHVRSNPTADHEAHTAFIESIGFVAYHKSLGIMCTVIALTYGWKFALFLLAVVSVVALGACASAVWLGVYAYASASNKDSAASIVMHLIQLYATVTKFWMRARNFAMLNASDVVISKVRALFAESHVTTGLLALLPMASLLPALAVFPYVAWKINKDESCTVEHCDIAVSMAVVYLASAAWFKSSNAINLWYSGSDLPTDVTIDEKVVHHEDDDDRIKVSEWLAKLAKPFQPSALFTGFKAIVSISGIAVCYVVAAYTTAWLFTSPYSESMRYGKWELTGVIAGAIALYGLSYGFWIHGELTKASSVIETIVVEALTARMTVDEEDQAKWLEMPAESFMEAAGNLGLVALSGQRLPVLAGAVIGVAIAAFIDPFVTLAVVAERLIGRVVISIQQCGLGVPGAQSWWILCAIDNLFRTAARGVQHAAQLALIYLQLHWIADGSSTLFSTLAAAWFVSYCFTFYETRGSQMRVLDTKTINFGLAIISMIGENPASLKTVSVVGSGAAVVDAPRLDGELVLEFTVDGHTESIHLPQGKMTVVGVSDKAQIAKITSSIMRLRRTSVVNTATVGSKALSLLATPQLRDRIMVVESNDPVLLPGTVRECLQFVRPQLSVDKVDAIATNVGIASADLETESPADSLQPTIWVGQVVVRNPDVLIIEDFAEASAYDTVQHIRDKLPACKVLVLTTKTQRWEAPTLEPEKETA